MYVKRSQCEKYLTYIEYFDNRRYLLQFDLVFQYKNIGILRHFEGSVGHQHYFGDKDISTNIIISTKGLPIVG